MHIPVKNTKNLTEKWAKDLNKHGVQMKKNVMTNKYLKRC